MRYHDVVVNFGSFADFGAIVGGAVDRGARSNFDVVFMTTIPYCEVRTWTPVEDSYPNP